MSITIVFIAHAGLGTIVPGGFGVTVFFFLSGFLITTLLRREFERDKSISFKNFYVRRVLRIFPPFYGAMVLATVVALVGLTPGGVDFRGVGLLAAHFGNYGQILWEHIHMPAGTGVYWSLAVEEHYYLTFPFVAYWLLRTGKMQVTVLALLTLAVAILYWRIYLVEHGASVPRTYLATDTRIDSILWGCVLAMVRNPVMDAPFECSFAAEVVVLLLGVAVLGFCFVYRDDAFRETYRYTLQGVALLPVFYLAILRSNWPVFRWLDWRPVRYIGMLSYTLYLVHDMILHSVDHWMSDTARPLRGILAAGLSVAIAALSYHYMEKPLANWRRKFS